MRFLIVLLALIGGVVAAGLTGLLFVVWPTSLGDKPVNLTTSALDKLASVRGEEKFRPDPSNLYFGTIDEQDRLSAETYTNLTLDAIARELRISPRRKTVLATMKGYLSGFPSSESEERDRYLYYLERVLDALELKDSGELFNVWRYGFPYGWFMSSRNAHSS